MPNTHKPSKTDPSIVLASLAEQAAELRAQAADLEQKVRLARGTGDHAAAAHAARLPVAQRVELALRSPVAPMSLVDLTAAVGAPAEQVRREVRRLASTPCPTRSLDDAPSARMIHDHGEPNDPRWAWVIGDATPTEELIDVVEKLIRRRAYTFAELTAATGARRGRLSGALVRLQVRHGRKIKNEGGSDRQYRWLLAAR